MSFNDSLRTESSLADFISTNNIMLTRSARLVQILQDLCHFLQVLIPVRQRKGPNPNLNLGYLR